MAGDGFAAGFAGDGFEAIGLPGDGFAAGVGFDAIGLPGDGFACDGFETVGLPGADFETAAGGVAGDFIGPFLMAACDTSVINMATAVKTAYAIILI